MDVSIFSNWNILSMFYSVFKYFFSSFIEAIYLLNEIFYRALRNLISSRSKISIKPMNFNWNCTWNLKKIRFFITFWGEHSLKNVNIWKCHKLVSTYRISSNPLVKSVWLRKHFFRLRGILILIVLLTTKILKNLMNTMLSPSTM